MNSYSQAGQDTWVYDVCGRNRKGTFLDVGCHDGHLHSNTLALEEIGWTGLLFDIQLQSGVADRLSPVVIGDALTADWGALITEHFTESHFIGYLSLDVDEATTPTLERILAVPVRFAFITVEHDAYRLGDGRRNRQRELLVRHGYQLAVPDVVVGPGSWGDGGAYEDWWTL
jgi:hypothetical protein